VETAYGFTDVSSYKRGVVEGEGIRDKTYGWGDKWVERGTTKLYHRQH